MVTIVGRPFSWSAVRLLMWIAWRFPDVNFCRNMKPPGPALGSVMVEPAGFPAPASILDQSRRSSSPNPSDGRAAKGALRRAALTTRWMGHSRHRPGPEWPYWLEGWAALGRGRARGRG